MSKKKMLKITISEDDWASMNEAVDNEISGMDYLDPDNLEEEDEGNMDLLTRLRNIKIVKVEKI